MLPALLALPLACAPPWPPPGPTWRADADGHGTGLGLGDVDGDGLPDLLVSSGNDIAPGPVRGYRGLGEGPPDPSPTWTTTSPALHGHLAVGDVNGDGYADVAVTRYEAADGGPGGVDLYLGGPSGLADAPAWSWTGAQAFGVALGDADGDGDLDLALATGHLNPPITSPDLLFTNEGGLSAAPTWSSAPSVSLDVAFVGRELVFARTRSPHARYAPPQTAPVWEAAGATFGGNRLALADLDGDGHPELLVSENLHAPGLGQLRLYCGEDWASCWTSDSAPKAWSAVAFVDLDGDGDLDVLGGQWWGPMVGWEVEGGRVGEVSWRSEAEHVAEAALPVDWAGGGFVVSDWEPAVGAAFYGR